MKRFYLPALATLLAAFCFVAPASAQNFSLVGCDTSACCDGNGDCDGIGNLIGCDGCDGCDSACGACDSCCGGGIGGSLYTEAELMFMKYDRADGVRVGKDAGEDVFGNYKTAPRLTVGWISDGGLGARIRYFEFDQGLASRNGGIEGLGVDTFTIDFELFEKVCLNKNWTLELSGGVRYNEFEELMTDSLAPFGPNFIVGEQRVNRFNGWGGVLGVQANRKIGRYGSVYGRMRGSIMADDKFVGNSISLGGPPMGIGENLVDSTLGMTEIAIGYEYNRVLGNGSLLFARAGFEWQNWYNYSSSFAGPIDTPGPSLGESIFTGPADVGFHGFTISVGIEL